MLKELYKKAVYDIWRNIIIRCNNPHSNSHYISYIDCNVCEEWLVFDNFYKWYIENYYQIPNKQMCVDKDLLYKNNKIYSPQTCCIIPHDINILLTKRKNKRGKYPIGVYLKNKKYIAKCKFLNKTYWLGSYSNEQDAFMAYKKFKEFSIKAMADKYKEYLPCMVYEALYNYKVEFND